MAELDSDWYFGSRISNEPKSDYSESSDETFIDTENRAVDNNTNDTSIKDTDLNSEFQSLIIDLDSSSGEESDSSLEEVISLKLNKLKQEQMRLTLLKEKSSATAETLHVDLNEVIMINDPLNNPQILSSSSPDLEDHDNNSNNTAYQIPEFPSCPLGSNKESAIHILKTSKFKQSTKLFAPPISNVNDGSAWIPKSKRSRLPIETRKEDIIKIIRDNRVIVLSGSTGCGKSTQVPQYILDDCLQRGAPVNIICTQPHHIGAISLAHHVALERNTKLHGQVGYHVNGKCGYSAITRLRYVTTMILLEMLKTDRYLASFTHVIMDEIHERNIDDDVMMSHLCVILRKNPALKLIIMSATMNVKKFANYFHEFEAEKDGFVNEIPWIDISKKAFPVDVFYLEDVYQALDTPLSQRGAIMNDPKKPFMMQEHCDVFINWIFQCHVQTPADEAFLVFSPGIAIIAEVEGRLMSMFPYTDGKPTPAISLIKLHSTITIDEQCLVMQRPKPCYRKIILATNIAESSITVPDVCIIFDSCLRKDLLYDKETRCYSLNEQWISKDCAEQRRGRAGRIYRFVPKEFFENLPDERTPEICRTPLNSLLLRCIYGNLGDPQELLSHCIDPPDDTAIEHALEDLEVTGAVIKSKKNIKGSDDWVQGGLVAYEYEITRLGIILAQVPLDLHSGLLVIYGAIFGALYDCMIIAAILQNKGVIVESPNQEIATSAALKRFHLDLPDCQPLHGGSDLIAQLRGYLLWEETTQNDDDFDQSKELTWCQQQSISLYWIREIQDLVITLRESLSHQGLCSPATKEERDKTHRNHIFNPNLIDNIHASNGNDLEDEEEKSGTSQETTYSRDIKQAILFLDMAAASEEISSLKKKKSSSELPELNLHNNHSNSNSRICETPRIIQKKTNPWMNVFDYEYEITSNQVKLKREPNILLINILLVTVFHHNMLRVVPNIDSHTFKNCPENFNRGHTIEFLARILPPKSKIIETFEKDIGIVQKISHPDNEQFSSDAEFESCYIEFAKPCKLLWTHSTIRNVPTLPDAVFLAHKYTSSSSNFEDTKEVRFYTVNGSPETSVALSPIFHKQSTRVFASKSSLFFPLIITPAEYKYYTVCAGKLLAVDHGKLDVGEYITCLIAPLNSEKNVGDIILALFANKLINNDPLCGWHVNVNLTQHPIFDQKPLDFDSRLIDSFRYFLKQALVEEQPMVNESLSENLFDDDFLSFTSSSYSNNCENLTNIWRTCKITPDQAGKGLIRTILLLIFSDLVAKVRESYPISEITPKELHDMISKTPKPIILDVREKDEQSRGIIPTAIPLSRGVLERDVERKVVSIDEVNVDNGRNIIVYCAGAESLIRLGYKKENVKSLTGGYDEWKEGGFEVAGYDSSQKS
ncbi:1671_t:CDS:10 [Entrophospora sp. SA101]|nr:1671_t:CDS:10 [Entrophospora sp. SA101]